MIKRHKTRKKGNTKMNILEVELSALAFDKILIDGKIELSKEVFNEHIEVLYRKKQYKYLSEENRVQAIKLLEQNAIFFNYSEKVIEYAVTKDNKFLELAIPYNT